MTSDADETESGVDPDPAARTERPLLVHEVPTSAAQRDRRELVVGLNYLRNETTLIRDANRLAFCPLASAFGLLIASIMSP